MRKSRSFLKALKVEKITMAEKSKTELVVIPNGEKIPMTRK